MPSPGTPVPELGRPTAQSYDIFKSIGQQLQSILPISQLREYEAVQDRLRIVIGYGNDKLREHVKIAEELGPKTRMSKIEIEGFFNTIGQGTQTTTLTTAEIKRLGEVFDRAFPGQVERATRVTDAFFKSFPEHREQLNQGVITAQMMGKAYHLLGLEGLDVVARQATLTSSIETTNQSFRTMGKTVTDARISIAKGSGLDSLTSGMAAVVKDVDFHSQHLLTTLGTVVGLIGAVRVGKTFLGSSGGGSSIIPIPGSPGSPAPIPGAPPAPISMMAGIGMSALKTSALFGIAGAFQGYQDVSSGKKTTDQAIVEQGGGVVAAGLASYITQAVGTALQNIPARYGGGLLRPVGSMLKHSMVSHLIAPGLAFGGTRKLLADASTEATVMPEGPVGDTADLLNKFKTGKLSPEIMPQMKRITSGEAARAFLDTMSPMQEKAVVESDYLKGYQKLFELRQDLEKMLSDSTKAGQQGDHAAAYKFFEAAVGKNAELLRTESQITEARQRRYQIDAESIEILGMQRAAAESLLAPLQIQLGLAEQEMHAHLNLAEAKRRDAEAARLASEPGRARTLEKEALAEELKALNSIQYVRRSMMEQLAGTAIGSSQAGFPQTLRPSGKYGLGTPTSAELFGSGYYNFAPLELKEGSAKSGRTEFERRPDKGTYGEVYGRLYGIAASAMKGTIEKTAEATLQENKEQTLILESIDSKLGTAPRFGGGGEFFTKGPTSIVVGDNPGGVEKVTVTPVSGVGTTVPGPLSVSKVETRAEGGMIPSGSFVVNAAAARAHYETIRMMQGSGLPIEKVTKGTTATADDVRYRSGDTDYFLSKGEFIFYPQVAAIGKKLNSWRPSLFGDLKQPTAEATRAEGGEIPGPVAPTKKDAATVDIDWGLAQIKKYYKKPVAEPKDLFRKLETAPPLGEIQLPIQAMGTRGKEGRFVRVDGGPVGDMHSFSGLDSDLKTRVGTVRASSPEEAAKLIRNQGIFPTEIRIMNPAAPKPMVQIPMPVSQELPPKIPTSVSSELPPKLPTSAVPTATPLRTELPPKIGPTGEAIGRRVEVSAKGLVPEGTAAILAKPGLTSRVLNYGSDLGPWKSIGAGALSGALAYGVTETAAKRMEKAGKSAGDVQRVRDSSETIGAAAFAVLAPTAAVNPLIAIPAAANTMIAQKKTAWTNEELDRRVPNDIDSTYLKKISQSAAKGDQSQVSKLLFQHQQVLENYQTSLDPKMRSTGREGEGVGISADDRMGRVAYMQRMATSRIRTEKSVESTPEAIRNTAVINKAMARDWGVDVGAPESFNKAISDPQVPREWARSAKESPWITKAQNSRDELAKKATVDNSTAGTSLPKSRMLYSPFGDHAEEVRKSTEDPIKKYQKSKFSEVEDQAQAAKELTHGGTGSSQYHFGAKQGTIRLGESAPGTIKIGDRPQQSRAMGGRDQGTKKLEEKVDKVITVLNAIATNTGNTIPLGRG